MKEMRKKAIKLFVSTELECECGEGVLYRVLGKH